MLQLVCGEQVERRGRDRDEHPSGREEAQASGCQYEQQKDAEIVEGQRLLDGRDRVQDAVPDDVEEGVSAPTGEARGELLLRCVTEGRQDDVDREQRIEAGRGGERSTETAPTLPGEHEPEHGVRQPDVLLHRARDDRRRQERDGAPAPQGEAPHRTSGGGPRPFPCPGGAAGRRRSADHRFAYARKAPFRWKGEEMSDRKPLSGRRRALPHA